MRVECAPSGSGAHFPAPGNYDVDSTLSRNAASPVDQAARTWRTGAVYAAGEELSVVKRLAILFLVVGVLLTAVAPAVAAERAVLAELFGGTW